MEATAADPEKPILEICTVAASSFMRRIRRQKLNVYAITLYKINKALEIQDLQEKPLEEIITKEYHEFLTLFSKVVTETLPLHWPYDHEIKLQDSFTLSFGPIYSLSQDELQVSKE
jgi:hypothetical protein